jgi:hypothetical protein
MIAKRLMSKKLKKSIGKMVDKEKTKKSYSPSKSID